MRPFGAAWCRLGTVSAVSFTVCSHIRLLLHLTDVYKRQSLFLAARLWDAVNDPIMGSFPDRWMLGKSGDKFKPWIKIFMIPLALSGVLCFSKVPFEGVALHAWVAFVYVLYGMSLSLIHI